MADVSRVAVTGASGFIGSRVVGAIVADRYDVFALSGTGGRRAERAHVARLQADDSAVHARKPNAPIPMCRERSRPRRSGEPHNGFKYRPAGDQDAWVHHLSRMMTRWV